MTVFDKLFYYFNQIQSQNCYAPSFRPRLPLSKFCAGILADHDRKTPVNCNACGVTVGVVGHGRVYYRLAISHACNHLGVILYKCRICNFGSKHEDGIRGHIFKNHALANYQENVIDKSAEYHDEIKEWIRKCFDKKDPANSTFTLEEIEK